MNDNKEFIAEYLQAFSGKPKNRTLLAPYVADPKLVEHIELFEAAFPNYEIKIADLIAEGDLVVARFNVYGTQKGTFAGIPPTGRNVSISGIIIYKIAERKIVQHWMEFNPMTLVQQLTHAPAAAQA
jgi:predicted SnoaL-like aldol condensation-catalyzing enzyme